MNLLWIFYEQTYQQYHLKDHDRNLIRIGNGRSCSITIHSLPFHNGNIELRKIDDSDEYEVFEGKENIGVLTPLQPLTFSLGKKTVTLVTSAESLRETIYYIGHLRELHISVDGEADINKHPNSIVSKQFGTVSFLKLDEEWVITQTDEKGIYINGYLINGNQKLKNGDIVFLPLMMISLMENDLLVIRSVDKYETKLPSALPPISEMKKKYPIYRRTPRMVYELPKDKVAISFPPQEGDDQNRGLWLMILPPVIMLVVMGIITLIQPRGIFIIVSMVMFITTIFTSSFQYFRERKNRRIKNEKRQRIYKKYLEEKREELQQLAEKQKRVLTYHYPSFEEMKRLTSEISERIWEKAPESEDFLHFRIGIADIPSSYEVSVSSNDLSNREMDDLLEESQEMVKIYKQVKNVPLTIDLASGSMGLVGKESIVMKEIQQLIGQLAFFHSYHDVRFVAIFHEKDYKDWEWMKWLPHFQLPHSYAKGLIYNEQTRDQLLSSIYEVIRERDYNPDKEKLRFSPHFVFIVSNRGLISEHVIMEYLEGKDRELGFSTIFLSETKESLSENIHTLVQYINERMGEILIQKFKAVHTEFSIDEQREEGNEEFSRMLRSLDHQKGTSNSIPEMVTFLELNNVKEAHELNIQQKWMTNQSSQSLAVPIGLKGKTDIVELNLHEKAHGPHGLVAGTTGSGKSEMLQTYILSLAVHFHPHEVAFLLIDYKGGGMAQPFKGMPHLLGTITNIEGSKNFSVRALASINSELKRRQRLFSEYEVNHINDYTDLYKEGKTNEPLPHLFLISDEFAELKNEEPDFIKELVSTARIGRSLGVHLILATQKPGGVINDQIWSNARFKICLKVQDATDSKEILKNSDAANITVTGRGYFQVGNNEVYELFQSAWSGAPYLEDVAGTEDEIAFVTDLGLIPISNIATQVSRKSEQLTEIDMIVQEIIRVQEEMQINKLPSPWLPPLERRLPKAEVAHNKVEFPIGLKDEPEKQSQSTYYYSWIEDGNIGIFGSTGYGKSTTIMTLLMNFAEQYTPEELHYYIFDFGNSALLPLRQLPHTGDYFRFDDQRKIEKFTKFMKDEMEHRKQLFLETEVSNIKLYNTLHDKKLPFIFITIDNFDLVKEEMQDIENQFVQYARDGQSLGIFVILSATRVNSVRQPLMNNLKTKVIHYLIDNSEVYTVLGGRVPYEIEAIPGRALLKKEDVYLSQIYMPADGEDDVAILENHKADIQKLVEKYKGKEQPPAIPMLPTRLEFNSFIEKYSVIRKQGMIPLGLDEDSVKPVYLDLAANPHCLVLGQSKKGKTNVLKVVIETMRDNGLEHIGVFDAIDRGLSMYAAEEQVQYLETKDDIMNWLDRTEEIFKLREEDYLQAIARKQLAGQSYSPIPMIIDSFSRFQQTVDSSIQDRITSFIKHYSHLGFHLIAAGNANEFSKGFDTLTLELKQIRQIVLLMKKSEQTLLTLSFTRKEEEIHPGFGYFIVNGAETKIQIPECSGKEVSKVV